LGDYAAIARAAAEWRFGSWERGQVIDVAAEMTAFTLEVIVRALFGAEAEPHRAEIGRAFAEVTAFFEHALTPWGHLTKRLPLPARWRYLQAVRALDEVLARILAHGASPMAALFEGLGPRELRDELMTLFVAGHETTASALTFALHLASLHPGTPVEGLIEETLRLYPPVWSIGRQALADDRFGIRRGDLIIIPVWRIHRDPRFYPEPDAFRPGRPLEGLPRGAYLPFGLGQRVCIGAGLAQMEMEVALSAVFSRFRVLQEGSVPDPLPLVGTLTARPRVPIRLRLA
jgi:cytochrome P450